MNLVGLPDFNAQYQYEGYRLFSAYKSDEKYFLQPQSYVLAMTGEGIPDLNIEYVRSDDIQKPPTPYGVLDFALTTDFRLEQALSEIRNISGKAYIIPLEYDRSIFRIVQTDVSEDREFDLLLQDQDNLRKRRIIQRLSRENAVWFKKSLNESILPLFIIAGFRVTGVAVRLSTIVSIDLDELERKFQHLTTSSIGISQEVMEDMIDRLVKDGGIQVLSDQSAFEEVKPEFRQAIIDKLVNSVFSLLIDDEGQGLYQFSKSQKLGNNLNIDLSLPSLTQRVYQITFYPFDQIYSYVQENGIGKIFRETIVPPLDTGHRKLQIFANLPENRKALLSIGVNIELAPNPPFRFQRLRETIEFTELDDVGTFIYRVAPGEHEKLEYTPFVIVNDHEHAKMLQSEKCVLNQDWLDLNNSDFPLIFRTLSATQNILQIADIDGIYWYQDNEEEYSIDFILTIDNSFISFAIPRGAIPRKVELKFSEIDGNSIIDKVINGEHTEISLFLLPEYGPHKILVRCDFIGSVAFIEVEFRFNDGSDIVYDFRKIHFTPENMVKDLTWFARSPFRSGFQYRLIDNEEGDDMLWSNVQSAFDDLTIIVGGVQ